MTFPALRHFGPHEFVCPCENCDGGAHHMDRDFLRLLDRARDLAGVPFVINSGYRCPEYNATLPNAVSDSSHTLGLAVDIATLTSRARFAVLEAMFALGVQRIGIGDRFIHVDVDDSKPDRVAWGY